MKSQPEFHSTNSEIILLNLNFTECLKMNNLSDWDDSLIMKLYENAIETHSFKVSDTLMLDLSRKRTDFLSCFLLTLTRKNLM
jgi:hypothetical protein